MRDFYDHQETARRNTSRMVGWMILALLGTTIVSGIVFGYAVVLLAYLQLELTVTAQWSIFLVTFVMAAVATAAFVTIASWMKVRQLQREGGASLARELGGQRVSEEDHAPAWRQLLNVVEEMAVAAGIPRPEVYVLPNEPGINAFAAGFSSDEALIGVTEGCTNRLSRDQLQGVVAHEFAHVLNGDMCMNLKLVGLLHGLVAITLTAEGMIQLGMESAAADDDHGLHGIGLILLGALMWPVGLIGFSFSLLVKAAISRQREFLADATAVELTRNPDGLGDALKVIAGHKQGSRVRDVHAKELSHLFFAEGCGGLSSLTRMHPPVSERVRRLDPLWDGTPLFEQYDESTPYRGAYESTMQLVGAQTAENRDRWKSQAACETNTLQKDLADWQGPPERIRAHTEAIRNSIPDAVFACSQFEQGAPAVLLALYVGNSPDVQTAVSAQRAGAVTTLIEELAAYEEAQSLLLLDTATKALEQLSPRRCAELRKEMEAICRARTETTTFQWACRWMVYSTLDSVQEQDDPPPVHAGLETVLGACEVLLSAVVYAGQGTGPAAEYAFQRAAAHVSDNQNLTLRPEEQTSFALLDAAMEQLRRVAPRQRRRMLLACAACLSSDQEISASEAHLIRGVCSGLRFPQPSLLPGQPVLPGT